MIGSSIKKEKTGFFFLLVFLLLNLCAYGGYHEFTAAVSGAVLAAFLLIFLKADHYRRTTDTYLLFSGVLALFYLISVFYATDSGMAWTGVIKKGPVLLFALALATMQTERRRQILELLPELAAGITVLAAAGACIPVLNPYIIMAGRFAGTFGYANTYAFVLLLALVVLLERKNNRIIVYSGILAAILILGMWFSGSRYTWVLAAGAMIFYGIRKRENAKWAVRIVVIFATATAGAGIFLRNVEAVGRFFTTNLSSLYGRLLYWQDSLTLIKGHPFGMGYLGYFYEQTQVQTGVYTVRYVHNDWMQWVLDIGWIPALILLVLLVRAICNRRRTFMERMLVALVLIHGCMEFDLEHNAVFFLLILILSCTEESLPVFWKKDGGWIELEKEEAEKNSVWIRCGMALCAFVWLYFSIPLSLYALGDVQQAAVWYPLYTDAQTAELSLEEDADTARELATQILAQNDTVSLAYDALAEVAYLDGDLTAMCRYKQKAIRRNKFDPDEYTDYLILLNEWMDDPEKQAQAKAEMKGVLRLIEQNKASVSRLGKMIDDQVSIDLPDEIVQEISE